MEKGRVREFGMAMYSLLYLKWINQQELTIAYGIVNGYNVAVLMGRGVWRRKIEKRQ